MDVFAICMSDSIFESYTRVVKLDRDNWDQNECSRYKNFLILSDFPPAVLFQTPLFRNHPRYVSFQAMSSYVIKNDEKPD